MPENEAGPLPYAICSNQFKMHRDLNTSAKTINLSGKKTLENHVIGFGDGILDMTSEAQATKEIGLHQN